MPRCDRCKDPLYRATERFHLNTSHFVSLSSRVQLRMKWIPRSFWSSSLLDCSYCALISRTSSPRSSRYLPYSLIRSLLSSRRLPFSSITVFRSRTSSATLRMYRSTALKTTLHRWILVSRHGKKTWFDLTNHPCTELVSEGLWPRLAVVGTSSV